jgi:hypothetical protein
MTSDQPLVVTPFPHPQLVRHELAAAHKRVDALRKLLRACENAYEAELDRRSMPRPQSLTDRGALA